MAEVTNIEAEPIALKRVKKKILPKYSINEKIISKMKFISGNVKIQRKATTLPGKSL